MRRAARRRRSRASRPAPNYRTSFTCRWTTTSRATGGAWTMESLTTEVAKNDLRSDVVIAVLLPSAEFADSDVASVVGVFARAFSAGTARNERESTKLANVLLMPDTGKYGVGDYSNAKKLIDIGYAAAK